MNYRLADHLFPGWNVKHLISATSPVFILSGQNVFSGEAKLGYLVVIIKPWLLDAVPSFQYSNSWTWGRRPKSLTVTPWGGPHAHGWRVNAESGTMSVLTRLTWADGWKLSNDTACWLIRTDFRTTGLYGGDQTFPQEGWRWCADGRILARVAHAWLTRTSG